MFMPKVAKALLAFQMRNLEGRWASRPCPNSWQERFWLRLLGSIATHQANRKPKLHTDIPDSQTHQLHPCYIHNIPQYVWDWVQCRYVFNRSARHSRAKFVNCMHVGTAAPFLGSLTSNLLEAPIVLVISNASTNACERSWPILLEALTWNPWQRIFPIRVSGSQSAVDMFANQQWFTALIFQKGTQHLAIHPVLLVFVNDCCSSLT